MKDYTGTLPDGTELLVTIYDDGDLLASTRSGNPWETWSPPVQLTSTDLMAVADALGVAR